MLECTLNGQAIVLKDSYSLHQLVIEKGFENKRIAIEVNHEIIPRSEYPRYPIKQGDRIEIVHAVGGG